jgi:hypothetical protein
MPFICNKTESEGRYERWARDTTNKLESMINDTIIIGG